MVNMNPKPTSSGSGTQSESSPEVTQPRRGRSAIRVPMRRLATSVTVHAPETPATSQTATTPSTQSSRTYVEAQEMAHYDPWTNNLELLSYGQWANAKHALEFVGSARRVNFAINEHRQQTLERLNKIVHEAPFQSNQRFPENGIYIDLDFGDWDRKMQQLRNALSFKDPKGADRGHTTSEFNDALLSFSNSLNAIATQIRRKDGVFTRQIFESYYDLVWVAN